MGIGLALTAVGAVLAFTLTGEVLGVDPGSLGVGLMIVGALSVAVGSYLRLRARQRRPTGRS